jgi:hypothetical protein
LAALSTLEVMTGIKLMGLFIVLLLFMAGCNNNNAPDEIPEEEINPPFSGTIFIDPNIITSSDSSTFISIDSSATGKRTMFDRRVDGWITVEAFLFYARFTDKAVIEVQVNPEFETLELAQEQALKYAKEIGRLPGVLKKDVETVWIHKGKELFGGGNNNLLIHTEQALEYIQEGILEETLVHEASHTSLDEEHARSAGWINAQNADPTFISSYAQSNKIREDIAESFLTFLALEYRSERIPEQLEK